MPTDANTNLLVIPDLPHAIVPHTISNNRLNIQSAETVTVPPNSSLYVDTGLQLSYPKPITVSLHSTTGQPLSTQLTISQEPLTLSIPVTNSTSTPLHIVATESIAYLSQIIQPTLTTTPTPDLHSPTSEPLPSSTTIDTTTGDVVTVENADNVPYIQPEANISQPITMTPSSNSLKGPNKIPINLPTWLVHSTRVTFRLPDSDLFLKGFFLHRNNSYKLLVGKSRK